MLKDISKLIQSNFIEKVTYIAKQMEGMTVLKNNNFVRVDCGLPSDTFNVNVILSDKSKDNNILEDTLGYFNDKNYPMALWCWDYLKDFRKTLDNSNLILGERSVGMFAHTKDLNPNPVLPLNFYIKEVNGTDEIKIFGNIINLLFGENNEGKNIKLYYDSLSETSLLLNGLMKLYIGYLDGKPVSTGSVIFTENSAGIYDIATLPKYRGKGLGLAMFEYILLEIKKKYDGYCVLQSSEDGMKIYEKSGFIPACNIYVYENRGLIK